MSSTEIPARGAADGGRARSDQGVAEQALGQAAAPRRGKPRQILKSLRPKQWTKNLLVFGALVFAGQLTDLGALAATIGAFAIFCALSSAAYLTNDVMDVEQDRMHPRKRLRPIASGAISRRLALTLAALLAIGGMAGAYSYGGVLLGVCAVYFTLTHAYSIWLKHIVIVDVIALSAGYVLRAIAGAVVIGVPASPWLLLCTTLLALFVGITKRRHELVTMGEGAGDVRKILGDYSLGFVDQMVSMVTSATIIAYALYTFEAHQADHPYMLMATFPFVVYGVFRYLYLCYRCGDGGSPEDLVLSDRPLLACLALWGATVVAILYAPWTVLTG